MVHEQRLAGQQQDSRAAGQQQDATELPPGHLIDVVGRQQQVVAGAAALSAHGAREMYPLSRLLPQ